MQHLKPLEAFRTLLLLAMLCATACEKVPPLPSSLQMFSASMNMAVPNLTLISANEIGHTSETALWCQSPLNQDNIGTWILPQNVTPPTVPTSPLYTVSEQGQIGLFRNGDITQFQGVYRCIVPNDTDFTINQTLLVWIYTEQSFVANKDTLNSDGSVVVEYLSPTYAVPLQYDITFNVHSGPPSNIDWMVSNGINREELYVQVDVIDHEYRDGGNHPDDTAIALWRPKRAEENHNCTIISRYLQNGIYGQSTNLVLTTETTITESPRNLTANRTSDTTATINWSPPESGPADLLYSVFQKSSDNRPIEELQNDAATTIQLTDLDPKIEYKIIVVATNPAQNTSLPSYPRSINISMQDSLSTLEITTKVRLVFGNGTELLNRTMISANDIGKTPNTALWCQSPLNESNIGTWLLPNGTNLTTIPTAPLYTVSEPGQAGLFLDRTQSFTPFEGVFRCIIPDENNNQTLLVWIYTEQSFVANKDTLNSDGSVVVEYLSPIYAVPLQYDIAFNVHSGPPSIIDWMVSNGINREELYVEVDVIDHEYRDGGNHPDDTAIALWRSKRAEENHTCTISSRYLQNGSYGQSTNLVLTTETTITESPQNLIATRTSDTTATINWSPPESGPTDLLYSVFQKSSDDRPIEELKNDAATTIQLIDLDPKIEYEIIVVATNPAQNTSLPSYPRSINISMQDSQSTLEITTKVRLVFGNGTELLNRTMISANDIGKTPNTALWCQSPLNESNIGTWLLPNGTNLTTIPTAPLYTMSEPGQAGLFLDRAQSFTLFEGVFRCIIPDENNINQTLMAWIYDDYIFNLVDGSTVDPIMTVSVLSPSYSIPLQYALLFNVSYGPPSNVTCIVRSNNRNDSISDDQIEVHVFRYQYTDTNVDVSTVIVRMSGRITGQVDCRVERFKMSGGVKLVDFNTTTANMNVTEIPSMINATRTEAPLNNIYWELPSSGLANLLYEVFVRVNGSDNIERKNQSLEEPQIQLPQLNLSLAYDIIVVADNRLSPTTLPSYPINITLPPYIPANLIVHTDTTLVAGSTFNATCMVMRGTLNFTVIEWTNKDDILFVNRTFYTKRSKSNILGADLTLSPLNTSNAGMYTCTTRVEDRLVELIGTEEVNVTVKVPSFVVSTLTSSYSDGSNATLHCNTKLHPTVDTGINVTVKWMRSEMIVFTTMAVFSNGSYWSSFNIDRVNSTTAGEYNCSFTVNGPFILGATASNIINITTTGSTTPPSLPQTEVRLYLDGSMLPNRTIISADDLGSISSTALWCQSSRNETNIGIWLLPNGTTIPTTPTGPLYTNREQGQVGLLRNGDIDPLQGGYRCIIPDENNTNQSLLIWIYRQNVFVTEKGPFTDQVMGVSVIPPSYSIPLQYNLWFNVSFVPPSNVTCTVWSNNITETIPDDQIRVDIFDFEYMGDDFGLSTVMVKMSGRIVGRVVCNVTIILLNRGNLITRTNTSSVNLNVTETPASINGTRTDKPTNNIYWALPTSGPDNLIYEVFYNSSENNSYTLAGRNETPNIHLPHLNLQLEYKILVVGINLYNPSSLPSYPANITLPKHIPANLTVHTETKLVAGSIFKATCKVTRGTLNFTDIEWTNNRGVIISNEIFYTETSPILSVNLTLGPLNTSNAGTYTCETHVEDYVAQLIGIKQVDIFVKVPPFMVSMSTSPSSPYSDSSNVTLTCSTQLPSSVDTTVNVTVNWIQSGVTLATYTPQFVNGTYSSSYIIESLNSSTSGEYNCSFIVSGATPLVLGIAASNTTIITLDITKSSLMPTSVITSVTSSFTEATSDLHAPSSVTVPSSVGLLSITSFTSSSSPLIQSTSQLHTPISVSSVETTTMSTTSSISSYSSTIDAPSLSPSMSSHNNTSPSTGGLGTGGIAGVATGAIVAAVLAAALAAAALLVLFALLKKRKKRRNTENGDKNPSNTENGKTKDKNPSNTENGKMKDKNPSVSNNNGTTENTALITPGRGRSSVSMDVISVGHRPSIFTLKYSSDDEVDAENTV